VHNVQVWRTTDQATRSLPAEQYQQHERLVCGVAHGPLLEAPTRRPSTMLDARRR
jgi:hypothetical protein